MKVRAALGACCLAFAMTAPAGAATTLLSEGFGNVGALAGAGWVMTNNSSPVGATGWFQGNTGIFAAAAGAADSYIAANFLNAGAGGAISNWLLTPELAMSTALSLEFSLRLLGDGFVDSVEVYYSSSGASADVGATSSSTGVFSLLAAYSSDTDTDWVNHTLALAAQGAAATGRLAFRYVVGNTDLDGNYIGIDSVQVSTVDTQRVPEPATYALALLALAGLGAARRRR